MLPLVHDNSGARTKANTTVAVLIGAASAYHCLLDWIIFKVKKFLFSDLYGHFFKKAIAMEPFCSAVNTFSKYFICKALLVSRYALKSFIEI